MMTKDLSQTPVSMSQDLLSQTPISQELLSQTSMSQDLSQDLVHLSQNLVQNTHVSYHTQPKVNSENVKQSLQSGTTSWLAVCKRTRSSHSQPTQPVVSRTSQQTSTIVKNPSNSLESSSPSSSSSEQPSLPTKIVKPSKSRSLEKQTNDHPKAQNEEQLRRRVFISNLPAEYSESDIREELEKLCGEIQHTLWFASRTDGKFYGSGLITFATTEGADSARKFNGNLLFGRTVRIEPSRCPDPVRKKPPGCQTIYLNNLSKKISDTKLRALFEKCGTIKSVRVLDRSNKTTNVAFIEFYDSNSTNVALEFHGKVVDGYPIHVDYQRNKF